MTPRPEGSAPEATPFVTVATTVKNAAATLRPCLDSFLALDHPKDRYEVVVVDAFSTDGTWEILQEYAARSTAPEIRIAERAGEIGAGRNACLELARGAYMAVTDGDMVVPPGWLRNLLRGFTLAPDVGAVGGPNNMLVDNLGAKTVSCIPVHGPTQDEVRLISRNRYHRPFVSKTDWYTNVTRNTMYRTDALRRIGGWKEDLHSTEDPEVNERLHRAGYATAYAPEAVVYHHHRDTPRAFYRQQRHYAWGHGNTNRKTPYMFRWKQLAPAAALACIVGSAAATLAVPGAAPLPLAIVAAGAFYVLAYAAKCAVVKRDPRLVATIPAYFLAWQWAWAWHYPRGLLGRPEW